MPDVQERPRIKYPRRYVDPLWRFGFTTQQREKILTDGAPVMDIVIDHLKKHDAVRVENGELRHGPGVITEDPADWFVERVMHAFLEDISARERASWAERHAATAQRLLQKYNVGHGTEADIREQFTPADHETYRTAIRAIRDYGRLG